jgi:mono/diheme cytochrome c family protein
VLKRFMLMATGIAGSGVFVLVGQQPVRLGAFSAAQADAGRTAYRTTCVKCHTESLTGRKGNPGEMPPLGSLPDDMQKVVANMGGKVPPLAGAAFMARWGGRTTKDLSTRIQEAVGGFPPEGANEETSRNLTAYILEVNGAKPGTEALTAATAVVIRSMVAETASQADPVESPASSSRR